MAQVGSSLSYFSITSKTSAGQRNLSNLGHFMVSYEIPVLDRVTIKPSYSLYIVGSDLSDLGYGLNLEFDYYPFSFNRRLIYKDQNLFVSSSEKLRPYVGLSFHQRQYQSIQSSYAGLGINVGADYQWQQDTKLNVWFASLSLSGPLDSEISEIQFGVGTTLQF